MTTKFCKPCQAVIQVDPDTGREINNQTGRPHKKHGTQGFCRECKRHYPNYHEGFQHMLNNKEHRLIPFDLDKDWSLRNAAEQGVPVSLLR